MILVCQLQSITVPKLENPVIISKKPSLTRFDSFKCAKIALLELRMKIWFRRIATSLFVRATVTIVLLVMLFVKIVQGQTQVNHALRACDYCLKNNFHCIRRVVLVITVDCESGNKQCLKQIQQELNENTINLHLSLLLLLPDVLRVLKTCKASFSNWYLQLNNKRGCLSMFYTLRKRAGHDVRKNVKSEIETVKTQLEYWQFVILNFWLILLT